MSFTAAIQYNPQLDPSTFQLQDISNYAAPDDKANISSRTLTILDSLGNELPDYGNPINFPYDNGDSFTIAGLTQDLALAITMTLTPISPQVGSTYSSIINIATNRFLQAGLFNIQVAKNNSIPSAQANVVYRTNSIDIIIEEDNSQTALLYSDFTGSQNALDRGQQIINNTQL